MNTIRKFRRIKTALVVGALAFSVALAGCSKETLIDGPVMPEGGDVTITVSIPAAQAPLTRSMAGGSGEAVVQSVDILVFRPGTAGGPEVLSQHAQGLNLVQSTSDGDQYRVRFKANLTIDATVSNVVLLANVANVAGKIGAETNKLTILARLLSSSTGKWNSNPTNAGGGNPTPGTDYTAIPMYGENPIASGGVKPGMIIGDVPLARMLARIDVVNDSPDFALSNVYVVNYNTAGYIAPAWNPSTGAILTSGQPGYPYNTNGAPHLPATSSPQIGEANALNYTYTAPGLMGDIYTYEALANSGAEGTAAHTNAACLVMKGVYGGNMYYYRVDFSAGTDAAGKTPGEAGFSPSTVSYMPLYRNHRYAVTLSAVSGPGYASFGEALASSGIINNMKTSLLVVDESQIDNITFDNSHYLGVSNTVTLGGGIGTTTSAPGSTNSPYGWQIDTSKGIGGIEYISGAGWLSASKAGAAAVQKANIDLTAVIGNSSGDTRSAYVYVKAGNLTNKMLVSQTEFLPVLPEIPDAGTLIAGSVFASQSFVGAFWRADQIGERLIKIPIAAASAGAWSAQVQYYGDFATDDILFSIADSSDPNVYSDLTADMNTSDATYTVSGNKTFATGTAATGGNIFFRIGLKTKWSEQPAYNSLSNSSRYAVIVIGYNDNTKFQKVFLRQGHEAAYIATGITGGAPRWSVYNLGSTPGTFMDYPSQAGYYKQWSLNTTLYPPTGAVSWSTTENYTGIANVCPPGYMIPDRIQAVSLALLDSPDIALVNGYYADGFFDRRVIATTVVSASTNSVAYVGRMLYNKNTNASIFMPFAGGRRPADGTLANVGVMGEYWTTSVHETDADKSYILQYILSASILSGSPMESAQSVRCIRP